MEGVGGGGDSGVQAAAPLSLPKTSRVICDREGGERNTKGPSPAPVPVTGDRLTA